MDTERKLENIVTDYYKAIGKYNNAKHIYEAGEYKILPTDDDETKKIKKGQQEELLVDLGRIGEMCFKYAIKLWQVTNFPNQSYEEFQDKSLEKLITRGVANTYKNQYHLDPTKVDAINQFQDETGQPRHNFSYLYKIIELLMPDLKDKFMDVMRLGIKSKNAEHFVEDFPEVIDMVIFPEHEEDMHFSKKNEDITFLIRQRNTSLMMDGDIFTRLRYFDMNETNTKLYTEEDIDHIFELISDIILFAKLIHLNKDNIDFNTEIMFSKEKLDNYESYGYDKFSDIDHISDLSKEQRDYFYFHPKLRNDIDSFSNFLFLTRKNEFERNVRILDCDEIESKDYLEILDTNIDLDTIKFFREKGITDYYEMASYLQIRLKTTSAEERLLNTMFGSTKLMTLDQFKNIIEKLNLSPENYDVLYLMDRMDLNMIKKSLEHKKLFEFLSKEFQYDLFEYGYALPQDLCYKLMDIKEVQDNPISWIGLDNYQLQIYSKVSKCIGEYHEDEFTYKNIIKNVEENIDFFKDTPQLLCIMPLMLDCDANNMILNILIRNGLDINNLKGFDSTILCYPVPLVELIETIFVGNGIPLIIDNNVNPDYKQVIQHASKEKLDIPYRTLLFYDDATPKNPIIKSLCQSIKDTNHKRRLHREYEEKVKEILTKMNSLDTLEFKKFYLESYKRKSKVLYGEDEENIKLT